MYTLRPFRNSREIRVRSSNARRLKKRFYTLGLVGLALSLLTAERSIHSAPSPAATGVTAAAVDANGGLVLLSGNTLLLHDRAGVATVNRPIKSLGLGSLSAPMAFDTDNALVATGRLLDATQNQLLRCHLETSACTPIVPELNADPTAFAMNPIDDSIIVAGNSRLTKFSAQGEVIASAEADLSENPALRLHAGLLFLNSAEGPGIGVYRYEDTTFGKQLDEVLLLPTAAVDAQLGRVGDFIWSGSAWWVTLYDSGSEKPGLYRFDDEWNSLGQVDLSVFSQPLALAHWGEKTLVSDQHSTALQRFNASGNAETPFVSSTLEVLVDERQQHIELERITWRGGFLIAIIITALGFGLGLLQRLRQQVYQPQRERGAELLDDNTNQIQWIPPATNRHNRLRYRLLGYSALASVFVLLGVLASVTAWQLVALMLALAGPALALLLLARKPIGHIGILGNRVVLVDHNGMYHVASSSGIQRRGPFLLIDDIVVFCGSLLIPAFQSEKIKSQLQPISANGIKVDRKTVLVKLLEGRHPLATGGSAILLCVAAALISWALQGVM
ncbi:MAG: hypothetical protein HRT77_16685 [Halioglobus sp.]|nr:hypothetical protein [Halioglobus sp.]